MPVCTLPPELWIQVISNVGKSGWLLNLALCCRSFYHLTLPFLYSDVKLLRDTYETGFPHLKPFTIHILKNPKLASHVRSFAMDQCWVYHLSSDWESHGVDENVQGVLSRSNLSHEEQEQWIRSLERNVEDAYLTLLLSSLPNLERLDLMLPGLYADRFEKLIQNAAKTKNVFHTHSAFSQLRVVINNCIDHIYGSSPTLLSGYLQLPSVREFYGQNVGSYDDEAHTGLATLESASHPLVHLELRESRLNATDLTNLLRACKNIKTFVYELGWGHINWPMYSTPELGKALSWIDTSLENLGLDYEGECYFSSDDDLSPIGTLSNFKRLKNLRAGTYVFFGEESFAWAETGGEQRTLNLASLMPASIETLYFSHTEGMVHALTRSLEKLLQAKESCTPKLRRITFEADITGEDCAFDYSRLDFLAKEVGVDVTKIDSKENKRCRRKDGSLTWAA